jgi:cytochrome c553
VIRDDVVHALSGWWRSLAIGLVTAAFCSVHALAQSMPLAERIKLCATCHGEDGNSRMEKIPSLAGQPEFFVLNQLFLMREGVRKIEAMMPFVKDLKDDDLAGLAKHFAGLTPKPSDEKVDPALARRGGELVARMRCGSCHQPDLAGQQQMPRVAKQRVDYLIYSLKAYRDDQRTGADTLMSNVVAGMPDSDIAALAHYAASR